MYVTGNELLPFNTNYTRLPPQQSIILLKTPKTNAPFNKVSQKYS